jgi:hypothetical protein
MIGAFSDRVVIRIKLDEHADCALSTFNQMLDDVRGVIVKHNSALTNVSVDTEFKALNISQEIDTHSKAS